MENDEAGSAYKELKKPAPGSKKIPTLEEQRALRDELVAPRTTTLDETLAHDVSAPDAAVESHILECVPKDSRQVWIEGKSLLSTGHAGSFPLLLNLVRFIAGVESRTFEGAATPPDELQERIKVPNLPPSEVEWSFEKPSNIMVRLGTDASASKTAKVFLEVPKDCFDKKDYLDYRCDVKKAAYARVLKGAIEAASSSKQAAAKKTKTKSSAAFAGNEPLSVEYFYRESQDVRRLGLTVREGETSTVDIVVCLSSGLFPESRLSPNVSNTRLSSNLNDEDGRTVGFPSPHYNASTQLDTLTLFYAKESARVESFCPNFVDAWALIESWLLSRSSSLNLREAGSVPARAVRLGLISMFANGKLSSTSSVISIVKRAFKWISEADGSSGVVRIFQEADDDASLPSKFVAEDREYRNHYPVNYVDERFGVNLASTALKSTVARLVADAKVVVAALASRSLRRIDECLSPNARAFNVDNDWQSFDTIVTVPCPTRLSSDASFSEIELHRATRDAFWPRYLAGKAHELVQTALVETGRAKSFRLLWSNKKPSPEASQEDRLVLSILLELDPDKAKRLVDRGPSAENLEECGRFRALWGDKAELRRFRDGAVVESVVWEALPDKRRIPFAALAHLFSTHEPFATYIKEYREEVRAVAQEATTLHHVQDPTQDEDFRSAIQDFQALQDVLVAMGGGVMSDESRLPLSVTSARADSPLLRYSSLYSPRPFDVLLPGKSVLSSAMSAKKRVKRSTLVLDRRVESVNVLVVMERSNKWPPPGTVERGQSKLALLLEMGRELESKQYKCSASLFDDNKDASLDVVSTATGRAFKLLLCAPRDENAEQVEAGAATHAMLHTLHVRSDVDGDGMARTSRLVKRWISANRLSNHFSDALVEMLVAHTYLSSGQKRPRGCLSGLSAFFCLMNEYPFSERPIMIVGDVGVPPESIVEAKRALDVQFLKLRDEGSLPAIALSWRSPGPEFQVDLSLGETCSRSALARAAKMSRKSLELLHALTLGEMLESNAIANEYWSAILKPSFNRFLDAELVVDDFAAALFSETVGGVYQNMRDDDQRDGVFRRALIDFDPMVQLVERFVAAGLGEHAEFFHSAPVPYNSRPTDEPETSRALGIVWKRAASKAFDLDDLSKCAFATTTLDEAAGRVRLNVEQVLDEMCRIGRGYVVEIRRFN